jgi:hypothetical protein
MAINTTPVDRVALTVINTTPCRPEPGTLIVMPLRRRLE